MALLAHSFMCLACMAVDHSSNNLPKGWMHLGWAFPNQLVICEKCNERCWDEGLDPLKWASEQWVKMSEELKRAGERRIVLRRDR